MQIFNYLNFAPSATFCIITQIFSYLSLTPSTAFGIITQYSIT